MSDPLDIAALRAKVAAARDLAAKFGSNKDSVRAAYHEGFADGLMVGAFTFGHGRFGVVLPEGAKLPDYYERAPAEVVAPRAPIDGDVRVSPRGEVERFSGERQQWEKPA